MQGEIGPTLAAEFPTVDEAQWRALVDKVLKATDFERRLVRPTADGIPVRPLYTETDAGSLRRQVGQPDPVPFIRGVASPGEGWDIRQRHAHPDPVTANAQIREDLERGVTSIQLRLDRALRQGAERPDGVVAYGQAELAQVLDEIYLDLAPIGLEAGARGVEAARALIVLAQERKYSPSDLVADLNVDPLGAAVAGEVLALEAVMTAAAKLAAEVASDWPGLKTLVADGRPYHAGGASEAQELACVVATGIAYLRSLTEHGLAPAVAGRQVGLATAVDADFFLGVAKLRALRRLWARVLQVSGAIEAMPAARLHAETSTRMMARRDPYVNMLRTTIAAFAAAAGGATSITVLPFDHALGLSDAFSRRIARNTQLVLLEESNLGRVIDPAGGSWYVESLTEALAQKAWPIVQEIERQGGMLEALRAGFPQELAARSWEERRRVLATRREPVTGVSEFPDLREAPRHTPEIDVASLARNVPPAPAESSGIAALPAQRLAAAFERLRDRSDAIQGRTGSRPRIFLCTLGRQAEFSARASFAGNLFEAGGLEAVTGEPVAAADQIGPGFKASGARLVAICSSDENYATMGEDAARALKHAHATRIYLMGRPEAGLQSALRAAGVDEFVHAGADVLATLERAHDLLASEAA